MGRRALSVVEATNESGQHVLDSGQIQKQPSAMELCLAIRHVGSPGKKSTTSSVPHRSLRQRKLPRARLRPGCFCFPGGLP